MSVFKREPSHMLRGILISLAAAIVVCYLCSTIMGNVLLVYCIAGSVFLFLAYSAIFHDNIRFEAEDGELRYYVGTRLEETFLLKDCAYRYKIRRKARPLSSQDIELQLTDLTIAPPRVVRIDCSPLGEYQFRKLASLLKEYAVPAYPGSKAGRG